MKKYFVVFLALNLLAGCSDETQTEVVSEPVESKQISLNQMPIFDFADKVFAFQKGEKPDKIADENEIVQAVNLTVGCTVEPTLSICDKNLMPSFIFMEDDSLDRPTEMSYKITELKPLAGGNMEVYTDSECNGNWFGLCQGRIIYVMMQQNGHWIVKDIYARSGKAK